MEHFSSQSAASSGMQRRADLSANKQTEHKIDFVAGMVNDAHTLGGSRGWPERLLGGQRQPQEALMAARGVPTMHKTNQC